MLKRDIKKHYEAILKSELAEVENFTGYYLGNFIEDYKDDKKGYAHHLAVAKSLRDDEESLKLIYQIYEVVYAAAEEKLKVQLKPTEFDVEKIYDEIIEGAETLSDETLKDFIKANDNIGGIMYFSESIEENFGLHGGIDPEDCYLEKPLDGDQTDKMLELYDMVLEEYQRILDEREGSLCE